MRFIDCFGIKRDFLAKNNIQLLIGNAVKPAKLSISVAKPATCFFGEGEGEGGTHCIILNCGELSVRKSPQSETF